MVNSEVSNKVCFYICPIGSAGSDVRTRTDKMYKHIIHPITQECGYTEIIRADKEDKPGSIGTQIISRLIESDMVIADLTGHNPNVFYELAIRHAVHKPVIQIIKSGENIPFDVAQMRTITVDLTDLDSVENCKNDLRNQINHLKNKPTDFDSPVSQKILLDSISKTTNPESQGIATLIEMVQSLDRTMDKRIDRTVRRLFSEPEKYEISSSSLRRIAQKAGEGIPDEIASHPSIVNEVVGNYLSLYGIEHAPAELVRKRFVELWGQLEFSKFEDLM